MFATFKTELQTMVADAFDLAIEFATLGEYRLPARDEAGAPVAVTYPTFEGLPVRGASCPTASEARLRGHGGRSAPPSAPRVRRDSPGRLEERRPVASARP